MANAEPANCTRADEAQATTSRRAIESSDTAAPVDLEIRVTTPRSAEGTSIHYELRSPSEKLDFFHTSISGKLVRNPEDYQAALFETLEKLHEGLDSRGVRLRGDEVGEELSALGQELYHELFPPELKMAYCRIRHQAETVLLVSDEPWIPWELVKPFGNRDSDDAFEDDHLCCQFQLTRWLAGGRPPASVIPVSALAALEAGKPPNLQPLVHAADEARLVSSLAARHDGIVDLTLEEPTHRSVVELLRDHDLGLLHFVGHGEFDKSEPNVSGIWLNDGRMFRPRDLYGAIQRRLFRSRPLVFISACQVAQQGWSLTQFGGWAQRLVKECGCGAFIGPQWTVGDEHALAFASAFYAALERGETFGRAALGARRALPSGLERLAFTVHAHPNGLLRLGSRSVVPVIHTAHRSVSIPPGLETIRQLSEVALNDANIIAEVDDPRIGDRIELASLYVNRQQEDDVIRLLLGERRSHSIILVKGNAGHGKTSLLWALGSVLPTRTSRHVWFFKAETFPLAGGPNPEPSTAISADELLNAAEYLATNEDPPILLLDTVDLLMHSPATRERTLLSLLKLQRIGTAIVLTSRLQEARLIQAGLDVIPVSLGVYSEETRNGKPSEMVEAVRTHVSRLYHNARHVDLQGHVSEILAATSRRRTFRDVCVNPLTLRMLFLIYAPDEIHSREVNVFELYEEFWKRRVESDQRGADHLPGKRGVDLTDTAAAVALTMIAEGRPSLDRRFLDIHVKTFGGRDSEIDDLISRGILLTSSKNIRFFHQSFLEHAAAHAFLGILGRKEGLRRLAERVAERPGNLFLTPVLEQALILASRRAKERQGARAILEELLKSSHDSLLLSGLYVYAHAREISYSNRITFRHLLQDLPVEVTEDYLDLIPNIDIENDPRNEELFIELDMVWKRNIWREQKKIIDLLRRFLPWTFDSVREALDRWNVVAWAAAQPGGHAAENDLLKLMFIAVDHDTKWTLSSLAELYRSLEMTRRKGIIASLRIIDFLVDNSESFKQTAPATQFERAVGLDHAGRLKDPLIESWGRLWAIEWRAQGYTLRHLFSLVSPFQGLAREGRLAGIAFIALEKGLEAVRTVFSHVEEIEDDGLRSAWCRTVVTRLLRVPDAVGSCYGDDSQVAEESLAVMRAREEARREVVARLARSCRGSELVDRRHSKLWVHAVDRARLPVAIWLRALRGFPETTSQRHWLDPDGLFKLLVPAAAAGVSQACLALEQAIASPASHQGILRWLVAQLEDACDCGLRFEKYLARIAIETKSLEPLLATVKRNNCAIGLSRGELQNLVSVATCARSETQRRIAYEFWRHAVRLDLLAPPSLDDLSQRISSEPAVGVIHSIIELIGQSHERSPYPTEELLVALDFPTLQNAGSYLGEASLRFLLRSMADDESSSRFIDQAETFALTPPVTPERLGIFARLLMPHRKVQAERIAEIIERILDNSNVQALSPAQHFGVRNRFLAVARDAFSRLAVERQRTLIKRVPDWSENYGGLIVDAATMAGNPEIWNDLEMLCRDPRVSPKLKRIIASHRRFEEGHEEGEHWEELYSLLDEP